MDLSVFNSVTFKKIGFSMLAFSTQYPSNLPGLKLKLKIKLSSLNASLHVEFSLG